MSLLSVGQPCFAKVKGFPAWPAKITAIQGNNKYEVFFFGTCEIASLAHNAVWEASPANMAKFITAKVKKRKFYAVGVEEMNKLIKNNPTYSTNADHSYSSPTKSTTSAPPAKKAPKCLLVLVDTRNTPKSPLKTVSKSPVKAVIKPKSPVKSVANPKPAVKAVPIPKSPVKTVTIPKPPVKVVPKPKSPVKSAPKSSILESVTPPAKENSRLSRKTPTPAKKKSPLAPPKPTEAIAPADKSTRRGEKRPVEEVKETQQTKKKKTEEPERIKVNLQLEMSEEAFLRIAKELPGILALTGHPIDLNMLQVKKK